MSVTSKADREIPVQGGVTPPAIRGAAEYVKAHYLDPNIDSLTGRAYRETWSKDAGSVELEWGFSPPETPGRVVEPLRGREVRLTIAPSSVSVAFPGLDPADGPGVRACTKVADDLEVLVNMFLTKAKTTSLYFIFSTGKRGPSATSPRHPQSGARP